MTSPKVRAWVARLIWGLTVLLACAVGLLLVANADTQKPPAYGFVGFGALLALLLVTVGTLIFTRRPGNAVGLLLAAGGLASVVFEAASEYAVYALLTAPGSAPFGRQAAWLATWLWVPMVPMITTFVLLLFPDGKLLSRRWGAVGWLTGAAIVADAAPLMLSPGLLAWHSYAVNPFGIPGASGVLSGVGNVGMTGVTLTLGASVVALALRYRGAEGLVRQQIKWLALAGVLIATSFTLDVAFFLVNGAYPGDPLPADAAAASAGPALLALVLLSLAAVPVTVGVAILRYRLYDIDRIISRTVTYGALTAGLAAVYVGGVALLAPLAGDSDLAVAGSTLAVAALFGPARRRLQTAVDRRFNRARFDARETVEAFSTRLRREVDLDTVHLDLLAVVGQTIEPTHVALWLRPPQAPD